jgi:hypothetical protein
MFRKNGMRQDVMNWMTSRMSWIPSGLKFLMIIILTSSYSDKIYYNARKSSLLVHMLPTYLFQIQFNIILSSTPVIREVSSLQIFRPKLFARFFWLIRGVCFSISFSLMYS